MSDLGTRWLDSDDPELRTERQLLRGLQSLPPAPAEERRNGWARLTAGIAAAATTTTLAKSAQGTSAVATSKGALATGLAPFVPWVVGAALLGSAAVYIFDLEPSRQISARNGAPAELNRSGAEAVAPPASSSAQVAATEPVIEPPERGLTPTRMRSARSMPPEAPKSTLQAEHRLLSEVRQRLVRGDTVGALQLLEQHRRRFPSAVLGQEREVLTIETLARAGRRADAARLADRFVATFPQSPHAARVQSYRSP